MKKQLLLMGLLAITLVGCENGSSSRDDKGGAIGSESASIGDSALSQTVQRLLKEAPAFSTTIRDVKVSVQDGKVTLTGTVNSEDQKNKISDFIQKINGVVSVDNQLQVNSNAK